MLLYSLHSVLVYLLVVVLVVVLQTGTTALNLFGLPSKRHPLLPHQSAAIDAVEATKAPRAQLVLPGGSGKTLIGNRLAREALSASGGGTVVVFLPTLTLLEQTLRSFYQDDPLLLDWNSQCLCVCSKLSFKDLAFTTDPFDICSFVGTEGDGPRLIFR